MKTFNATDAKNKFGELIDTARTEPVIIQKNGRDVAVVISKEEYEKGFSKKGPNPLVLHIHEEMMEEFAEDFRRMAE